MIERYKLLLIVMFLIGLVVGVSSCGESNEEAIPANVSAPINSSLPNDSIGSASLEESVTTPQAEEPLPVTNVSRAEIPRELSGPRTHRVNLTEKGFDPSTITIRAGDTVAWNVTDDRPHTVYSKNVLGSDILIKDMLYNYTFARQGIYSYNCGVHREDIGKVIVLPS